MVTNVENFLKSIYLSAVADRLNTAHPLLTTIEQTSNNVWGKEVRYPKSLGEEGHVQFVSPLKNLYGTLQLSEREIKAFRLHDALSFTAVVEDKMQELICSVQKDMSRMLFSKNKQDKDLTGIVDIFDTSKSLYGLDRAPYLTPIIKNTDKIDDSIVDSVIDEVEQRGGRVNFILVSRDMKNAYVEQHEDIDVIKLCRGFKAMSYNGIPLVYDKNIPQGTVYLLDTDKFKLQQLCDWTWSEDSAGHVLHKTGDIYTAMIVKYAELICDAPDCQAMIKVG